MTPRTITAAFLRDHPPPHDSQEFSAPVRALLADALEIADDAAKTDIESQAWWTKFDGVAAEGWYDVEAVDAEDLACVERAVRYLEQRGRIVRHPVHAHMLRVTKGGE